MGKFVIIVGLSGCGKSTLLSRVTKVMEDISIVNYGRAILSIASARHLEPDTIRKQSHEVQKELRLQAAKKIKTESKGLTLLDTHSFIKTKFGFMPGIPEEIVSIFKPKGFLLIKADPDEIYHRRLRDKLRSRDKQNLDEIKLHQDLSQSFISSCSFHIGAPLKVISNREGDIDHCLLELVRFLECIKEGMSD